MIFLIQYDRQAGRILELREFEALRTSDAERERIALELELHRLGLDHEVVLLEAMDRASLRSTHLRYFDDFCSSLTSGLGGNGSSNGDGPH